MPCKYCNGSMDLSKHKKLGGCRCVCNRCSKYTHPGQNHSERCHCSDCPGCNKRRDNSISNPWGWWCSCHVRTPVVVHSPAVVRVVHNPPIRKLVNIGGMWMWI